ncbi:relaxase/mobilization nuclease domain-containing protein [Pseudomonas knackmussii]|uniref:relaxase/mobilization nuclease domain-containing protein n=1 Tax=Pseudomonas knackmussii TaxID=65741 RepID=UPI00136441F1|nr:LPD7 domain-containing protein [Pseudomonas knackmussii]
MIVETSKVSDAISAQKLVVYLLSDKEISLPDGERVLLATASYALPPNPSNSALDYAKKFSDLARKWTAQHRANKKTPKSIAQSVTISFYPGCDAFPKDSVDPSRAIEIAQELVGDVAPGKRLALYVVHGDTRHLHVHVLFSTVCSNGRIWNPHHDYRLWEGAAEKLEIKYNLYRTPNRISRGEKVADIALDHGSIQMEKRTGDESEKRKVKFQLSKILSAENIEFREFVQICRQSGLTIILTRAQNGRISGISFQKTSGLTFKGSQLNRDWSWSKLSRRLNFDEAQHRDIVDELERLKPTESKLEIKQSHKSSPGGTESKIHTLGSPNRSWTNALRRFRYENASDGTRNYYWRNQKRCTKPAFSDRGDKIITTSRQNQTIYLAMAELAKNKGWGSVEIHGSDRQALTKLWLACALTGLTITNFTPSNEELIELLAEAYRVGETEVGHQPCSTRSKDPLEGQ